MRSDITVIVRTVGERTEDKCVEYLRRQFGNENVSIVKNITPFTEAIQKSFEIGMKKNKKWTFIIDADVFLMDSKIDIFLYTANEIEKNNDRVFSIQPFVYDNFMLKSRLAGVHLYNTKYIEQACKYIGNNMLRPESFVIKSMNAEGYTAYKVYETIGVHDFFQRYEDIVAKGILHSKKHANINELKEMWEKKEEESDFYWINQGCSIAEGISIKDMKVDAEYIHGIIREKKLIFPDQKELANEEIDRVLKRYEHEVIYEIMQQGQVQQKKQNIIKRIIKKFYKMVLRG